MGAATVGLGGNLGDDVGLQVEEESVYTQLSDRGKSRTAETEGVTFSLMTSGALVGGTLSNQLICTPQYQMCHQKGV